MLTWTRVLARVAAVCLGLMAAEGGAARQPKVVYLHADGTQMPGR